MINRQSKVPLHEQLYEIFRGFISKEEWKAGDMIPAEQELIDQYGVSRIVVRQVLNRLVNEGLVYRQQGRGSFIAKASLEQGLTRIISFTEDMRVRGLAPTTRTISATLLPAPAEVAARLQIPKGEQLIHLERLRLANNESMSVEESFLVHRFFPGLLESDLSETPLRERLEEDYGIRIVRALQTIRAIAAPAKHAKLLTVPLHSPLLFIERVSFSQQNQPVEFLRIYYRGDRYSLYNELRE